MEDFIVIKNYSRHKLAFHPTVEEVCFNMSDGKVILAGGAIRDGLKGRPIVDYDLFFKDIHIVSHVERVFLEAGWEVVFKCPKGMLTTLKHKDNKDLPKVQFISKRSYSSIGELLRSFDFSICQFAMTEDKQIYTTKKSVHDNNKMRLSLVNLEYPTASINRVGKYKAKGFWCGQAIKDIVLFLVNMTPEQYDPNNDELYID